jgi:hypothetical protein
VQELFYSAIWGCGPLIYNGLCAFFSAVAAVFFALILKHLRFRYFFLAALAFAFVPVVYISSTYTIDFMWSEAFVLISFYFLLKEKFYLAGIFLGLATGCRITCGVMLVPYAMIAWQQHAWKDTILRMIKIAVPMGAVALIAFLPVILRFGTSFFMYYDQFPYPPLAKVLYKMTIGVFGVVGIIALLFFMVIALKNRNKSAGDLFKKRLDKKIIWAGITIIVLYLISYFRLPQKSGYMIPVIPFVILLSGYYLSSAQFRMLCYSFILSSFICSINLTDKLRGAAYSSSAVTFTVSGQEIFFDVFSGPVFSDYSKRKQKMDYTYGVITKAALQDKRTVIISGWWYNEIMVTTMNVPPSPDVIFEPYITESKMKEYAAQGYVLTYLPEQDTYNDLMYKMNYTDAHAVPF